MSKTILIIEDDVVSRDLLKLVLEYEGFHCLEAGNGALGLSMLESHKVDIIILDNAMPKLGGIEFLQYLQQFPIHSNAPIIMITGSLTHDIREKASKLGTYAIVGKPYDIGEIRTLVSQLCLPKPSLCEEPSLMEK